MHYKQVIVARRDLKMSPGKLAAQVAHASMGSIFQFARVSFSDGIAGSFPQELCVDVGIHENIYNWLYRDPFTKVVLGVDSESELLELYSKLREYGLYPVLITDSGKTEFKNVPTNTCFGLPPFQSSFINTKTGHLKLF